MGTACQQIHFQSSAVTIFPAAAIMGCVIFGCKLGTVSLISSDASGPSARLSLPRSQPGITGGVTAAKLVSTAWTQPEPWEQTDSETGRGQFDGKRWFTKDPRRDERTHLLTPVEAMVVMHLVVRNRWPADISTYTVLKWSLSHNINTAVSSRSVENIC